MNNKLLSMMLVSLAFGGLWALPMAYGQSVEGRLMGLQQDVMALQQKLGSLSLEVEALRAQNDTLREQVSRQMATAPGAVTSDMLRLQLEGLRAEVEARADRDKQDILSQISKQIDKLGATLNAAPAKAAKDGKPVFAEDYPKEGIAYSVKPGDTLSKIAQENHATIKDIQNANKIADPKSLRVGQQLFIPQRS